MGEPLVNMLAEKGHEVYVTSRQMREYGNQKVRCIKGNAHDMDFLDTVLRENYDVLIDFMSYSLSEVQERLDRILDSVGQYIFLSSCRVYAESKTPITEDTPRLLDVCGDKEYLATEEYALAKAREENLLFESGRNNWTIVRPTVTYNSRRLQLGCYELEEWFGRALRGKPVVFFDDLVDKLTSMTYGGDVAAGISYLVGNPQAMGEVVNIASPESKTWGEILEIYKETLAKSTRGGYCLQIVMLPHAGDCENVLGRKWRLKYNRIYNRQFDSSKMARLSGGRMTYTPIGEGLEKCVEEFLKGGWTPGAIAFSEAYFDKVLHTQARLSEFPGWKQKVKYLIGRYTPYFAYKRMTNR